MAAKQTIVSKVERRERCAELLATHYSARVGQSTEPKQMVNCQGSPQKGVCVWMIYRWFIVKLCDLRAADQVCMCTKMSLGPLKKKYI